MKQVESFRLTKEQQSWMKEFKKVTQIEALLAKGALKEWYQQGNQLKRLFGQLEQKKQALQQMAPQERMNEIPGQPSEEPAEESAIDMLNTETEQGEEIVR